MKNRDTNRVKLSAVSDSELHGDFEPTITRRSLLKNIGFAAAGATIASQPIYQIDQIIAQEKWPPDSTEIIGARGSERLPLGGEEWLVFGGFGQKYSTNAAQELFNAIGKQQVVTSIKYPNQGFTIDDLSIAVEEHIATRKMKALNVVGVSMGFPTALMTLKSIQHRAMDRQGISFIQASTNRPLPELKYLAAYSSPADLDDAMDKDIANYIAWLSEQTKASPGVILKLLWSMFDGDGDPAKVLNIRNFGQWSRHMHDSIDQTFNDCPPKLVQSQIQHIRDFNVEDQWQGLRDIVSPQSTRFVYCAPSNYDNTVNNAAAAAKYKKALDNLYVPTVILDTGNSGHANTVASAVAISNMLAEDRRFTSDTI